jgi:hypothetical protein
MKLRLPVSRSTLLSHSEVQSPRGHEGEIRVPESQ